MQTFRRTRAFGGRKPAYGALPSPKEGEPPSTHRRVKKFGSRDAKILKHAVCFSLDEPPNISKSRMVTFTTLKA